MMNKSLIALILVLIVILWKFVFSSSNLEYTDQAKVLQAITLTIPLKIRIKDYWLEHGQLPMQDDWNELDDIPVIDSSQSLIDDIEVGVENAGVIGIFLANKSHLETVPGIDESYVLLKPYFVNEQIKWACQSNVPTEVLPRKCAPETVAQDIDETDQ